MKKLEKLEKIIDYVWNSEPVGRVVGGFLSGTGVFGGLSWSIHRLYAKEHPLVEKLNSTEQFEMALQYGLCGGLVTAGMFGLGCGIEYLNKKWDEKKMEKWAKENKDIVEYYENLSKIGEYKEKK